MAKFDELTDEDKQALIDKLRGVPNDDGDDTPVLSDDQKRAFVQKMNPVQAPEAAAGNLNDIDPDELAPLPKKRQQKTDVPEDKDVEEKIKGITAGEPTPAGGIFARLLEKRKLGLGDTKQKDYEDVAKQEETKKAADEEVQNELGGDEAEAEATARPNDKGVATKSEEEPGKTVSFGDGSTNPLYSRDNLLMAQQLANKQRAGAEIGKAGEQLGTAFSGGRTKATSQGLFDEQAAHANDPIQQMLQAQEMEKSDPNSDVSKGFKDFAKQYGVNVQGNFSAAMGEKLLPFIFKGYEAQQQREARHDDVNARLEARSQDMADKNATLLSMGLQRTDAKQADSFNRNAIKANQGAQQLVSNRGALGKANATVQSVEKLQSSLDKYPDLNKMPPELVADFVAAFNNTFTGGQASDAKFKKILPKNLWNDKAKAIEWFTGNPSGAAQGQFVRAYMDVAEGQKKVAENQIKEGIAKHYRNSASGMHPTDLETQLGSYGLTPQDIQDYKPGMFTNSKTQPKAQSEGQPVPKGKVIMTDPQGRQGYVPQEQVQDALAQGYIQSKQ